LFSGAEVSNASDKRTRGAGEACPCIYVVTLVRRCPAQQALTSPSLFPPGRAFELMRRGAGSAAQPCLGMRSAGCSRVKQLPQVTCRLDTRVRAQTRRPSPCMWCSPGSPRRRRSIQEVQAACTSLVRARTARRRAQRQILFGSFIARACNMHRRGAMSSAAPATLHFSTELRPRCNGQVPALHVPEHRAPRASLRACALCSLHAPTIPTGGVREATFRRIPAHPVHLCFRARHLNGASRPTFGACACSMRARGTRAHLPRPDLCWPTVRVRGDASSWS